jgi:hypothetical protein
LEVVDSLADVVLITGVDSEAGDLTVVDAGSAVAEQ